MTEEFKVNFSLSSEISYAILPSPHFIIQNVTIFNDLSKNQKIADIKKLKIFISQKKFLNKISKEKKELTLNFDWTLNQVSIKENELDSAMPINDSIKDRITLKYALMTDLINNRLSSQYSLYEGDKIKIDTASGKYMERV